MGRFEQTLSDLEYAAKRNEGILVSYSGGKDSLCVMDLCVRRFKRVEAFFMYLIPGLECMENLMGQCEARWGVKPRQYPHPLLPAALKGGSYCQPHFGADALPELKMFEVYQIALAEAKMDLIATGAKKADSIWRKKQIATWGKDMLMPLVDWSKHDVIAYLQMRGIPLPQNSGKNTSGIDLTIRDLIALHDNFPADFDKLAEVFPYVWAAVKRRDWYGLTK
jgi:3'-phosphoadenosine 5'-phosphosulfate sulfotransferase (PAPS reductase)/FAD synthetase